MIHARIDTVGHRQIVAFQVGTRAQFDALHGGDPLWVFVDSYQAKYRADLVSFLNSPRTFKVDTLGNMLPSVEAPIVVVEETPISISGYVPLVGADGLYLKGTDGAFLFGTDPNYAVPPAGQVYLLDPDGTFIVDSDGDFLRESI